jgi:hypothetical protein
MPTTAVPAARTAVPPTRRADQLDGTCIAASVPDASARSRPTDA